MSDFTPVKVYFLRDSKGAWQSGWVPYKELTANTADELAGLLHIGWTLEPPKEAK